MNQQEPIELTHEDAAKLAKASRNQHEAFLKLASAAAETASVFEKFGKVAQQLELPGNPQ